MVLFLGGIIIENLFVFLTSFVVIFIIYFIIYLKNRRNKSIKKMPEIRFLISKNHLSKKTHDYNKIELILVLINSLIISFVGTIITMINLSIVWQLMIGFVLLVILIIILYSLIGIILKKKEGNVK